MTRKYEMQVYRSKGKYPKYMCTFNKSVDPQCALKLYCCLFLCILTCYINCCCCISLHSHLKKENKKLSVILSSTETQGSLKVPRICKTIDRLLQHPKTTILEPISLRTRVVARPPGLDHISFKTWNGQL